MADFLTGGRNLCKDYSVILGKTDTVQQNVLTQKDFIYHEDADTTYVYTRNDIIFPQIVIPNGFTLTDQKTSPTLRLLTINVISLSIPMLYTMR